MMGGNDDEATGEARLQTDGVALDGLRPITLPSFEDGDDLATESLEEMSQGTELPSRYEVRESLGREDLGDLFLVDDRELGRAVVLKLMREDAPLHAVAAFREEARTVARVNHPGAVTVYDLGTLSDGRPYVTRAVLDGRPLGSWAQEVEPRKVVRWLMWATDTVAAAQAVKIVHRRLDPDCIVVGRVVKVRGFGSGVADPSPFMAPELVRGEPSDLRADVFSLGAIGLDVLGPNCPGDLEPALRRAVSERPADRQASAQALLADLEDWLDR